MSEALKRISELMLAAQEARPGDSPVTLPQRWLAKGQRDPKSQALYLKRVLGKDYEIRPGEDGNYYVGRKGSGDYKEIDKVLDPEGFDIGDIGDLWREAVGVAGDVGGAAAGALAGSRLGPKGMWLGAGLGAGLGGAGAEYLSGKAVETLTGQPEPSDFKGDVALGTGLAYGLGPLGPVTKKFGKRLGGADVVRRLQTSPAMAVPKSIGKGLTGIFGKTWEDFWSKPARWGEEYWGKGGTQRGPLRRLADWWGEKDTMENLFRNLKKWREDTIDPLKKKVTDEAFKATENAVRGIDQNIAAKPQALVGVIEESVNKYINKKRWKVGSEKHVQLRNAILDPINTVFSRQVPYIDEMGELRMKREMQRMDPLTILEVIKHYKDNLIAPTKAGSKEAFGKAGEMDKIIAQASNNVVETLEDHLDSLTKGEYRKTLKNYGQAKKALEDVEKIIPDTNEQLYSSFLRPDVSVKREINKKLVPAIRDRANNMRKTGSPGAADALDELVDQQEDTARKLAVGGAFYKGLRHGRFGDLLPTPRFLFANLPERLGPLAGLYGGLIYSGMLGEGEDAWTTYLGNVGYLAGGAALTHPYALRAYRRAGRTVPYHRQTLNPRNIRYGLSDEAKEGMKNIMGITPDREEL